MNKRNRSFQWSRITESRLFLPLVAIALILLFDALFVKGFFEIGYSDGKLSGSLINILRNSSTVILLAI